VVQVGQGIHVGGEEHQLFAFGGEDHLIGLGQGGAGFAGDAFGKFQAQLAAEAEAPGLAGGAADEGGEQFAGEFVEYGVLGHGSLDG